MKVKELKAILGPLPDDMMVIVARDAEGNGYHELADSGVYPYEVDGYWIELRDDDDDEWDDDDEEDETPPTVFPEGLVLWP